MNLLFICTQNRLRSPTAEQVFSDWPGLETASAGLGNEAEVPVSPELLEWADIVFVMEQVHRRRLTQRFKPHLKRARVICLGIPDDFEYMQPELVALLMRKVPALLPSSSRGA